VKGTRGGCRPSSIPPIPGRDSILSAGDVPFPREAVPDTTIAASNVADTLQYLERHGRSASPGTLDILGDVVLSCAAVGDVLDRRARYVRVLNDGLLVDIAIDAHHARVHAYFADGDTFKASGNERQTVTPSRVSPLRRENLGIVGAQRHMHKGGENWLTSVLWSPIVT
jgi:hypothetical protein